MRRRGRMIMGMMMMMMMMMMIEMETMLNDAAADTESKGEAEKGVFPQPYGC